MKITFATILVFPLFAFSTEIGKITVKSPSYFKGGDYNYRIKNDSIEIIKACKNGETCDSAAMKNGFEVIEYRKLSDTEKDSVSLFIKAANKKSSEKSYSCDLFDGYGYYLHTDKLVLKCRNCHECKSWISFGRNEYLSELGKYTCWIFSKSKIGRRPRPCWRY